MFIIILNILVYTNEIFKVVEQVKPDVIFVHCVETITAMRFLLKGLRYPMMFDSHMLSMASQNRLAKIYEKIYGAILYEIPAIIPGIINNKVHKVVNILINKNITNIPPNKLYHLVISAISTALPLTNFI